MPAQSVVPIKWRDQRLELLDQRLLPQQEVYNQYTSAAQVAAAITDMVVRGAPAIGITAAYAVVLSAQCHRADSAMVQKIQADMEQLWQARPTAVNLHWALEQMRAVLQHTPADDAQSLVSALFTRAEQIHQQDIDNNIAMGRHGAGLIKPGSSVLTHCNAGALATGGYGTALGVIRAAWEQGRIDRVYADETRPWLQGSRLTAWELIKEGIPVTLIAEGAAAHLMQQGRIDWVIVGSDRIAANGDVANKIGTYSLAVNARHHGVRFMVAAPTSTIDMDTPNGKQIPIEDRDPTELLCCNTTRIAAAGAEAWNPVFDVTPAELVDVLVTEEGVDNHPCRRQGQ